MAARKMDSETARAMAAQRTRVTVICVECGQPIENVTPRRRYHPTCRHRAMKRRQRAKAKA
jgi:hypothetical protein